MINVRVLDNDVKGENKRGTVYGVTGALLVSVDYGLLEIIADKQKVKDAFLERSQKEFDKMISEFNSIVDTRVKELKAG